MDKCKFCDENKAYKEYELCEGCLEYLYQLDIEREKLIEEELDEYDRHYIRHTEYHD